MGSVSDNNLTITFACIPIMLAEGMAVKASYAIAIYSNRFIEVAVGTEHSLVIHRRPFSSGYTRCLLYYGSVKE